MNKQPIHIVWFKRDFRLVDNEALFHAHQSGVQLLLVCFFEPRVMSYDDSDVRHWRFVYESIQDLNKKLAPFNARIYFFHDEVKAVFSKLIQEFDVKSVFSHQEIGNKVTYDRDVEMKAFFDSKDITWKEFQLHGVIRKLKSRQNWDQRWEQVMRDTPKQIKESDLKTIVLNADFYDTIKGDNLPIEITTPNPNFQRGGEYWAWRYLDSFVK